MGGCASKPKDLDISAEPTEKPTTPKKPEPEVKAEVVVPQENENGGETKKDELLPLVDISEPSKEEAALKSEETLPETEIPTTTSTEVEAIKSLEEEVKPVVVEAANEEPKKEELKEEELKNEDPKKEEVATTVEVAAEAVKVPDQEKVISPKSQDKSDAPLVTV